MLWTFRKEGLLGRTFRNIASEKLDSNEYRRIQNC
jgi:hypothetical protein